MDAATPPPQTEEQEHVVPGTLNRLQSFDGFKVKTISFLGRRVPILLQNEFGPCAILALVNVLLLRNVVELSTDHGSVPLSTVVSLVANRMLEANEARASGGDEIGAHLRRGLDDAIALLPRMETGLDVNVRFSGGFEYTECLSVFDLCDVSIVHGWRCDPEETAASVVGTRGYNEVVSSLVSSEDEVERSIVQDFLEQTATQLTYHGLAGLHESLRDRELAVLYRNMHFSTLFKHNDKLFVLVTDLGYQREAHVVWDTLDDVNGDTQFVAADFRPRLMTPVVVAPADQDNLDPDFLVALQLSQDDQHQTEPVPSTEDADYQAALRLQMQLDIDAQRGRASDDHPTTHDTTTPQQAQQRPHGGTPYQRRPPSSPAGNCLVS